MRKIFILLSIVMMSLYSFSQTVDNIRAEQNGNNIIISYSIANSNANQLFKVAISARINNGKETPLKSLNGDFGDNIKGGKSVYKVEWNVLQDVAELTDVEFFVKAELKSDRSTNVDNPTKKGFSPIRYDKQRNMKFYLALQTFGIKGGIMGKWGVGLSLGTEMIAREPSILFCVSKSIIRKQSFQWNICPIVGVGTITGEEEYNSDTGQLETPSEAVGAFGLGTDFSFGHLYFNLDNFIYGGEYGLMLGVGWRF